MISSFPITSRDFVWKEIKRENSHKEAHKSSLLENRHRRLRGDTFDFFETKACGNTLNYIQSLYGGFYDNIQSGIIANTCFQCSNQ